MEAAFGRGTLYTADGNELLADVYYFIQPKTCPSRSKNQLQGFIDPILEYTALSEVVPHSRHLLIELDNGNEVEITLDESCLTSSQIPLFFSARSAEMYASLSPDEARPVSKPKMDMARRSPVSPLAL